MRLPRFLRDSRHARWAVAARQGDAAAFRSLYRELATPVWSFVARRLHGREDAEEVVSAVFHRLLERLATFDPRRGSVTSWVLAIAHSAVIDHLRSRRPTVALDDLPQPPLALEPSPLERVLAGERQRRLARLLEELPAEARQLLVLRFELDLGYRDIASRTGLSEGAARQRVSRAVRQLRGRLGEGFEEDAGHA